MMPTTHRLFSFRTLAHVFAVSGMMLSVFFVTPPTHVHASYDEAVKAQAAKDVTDATKSAEQAKVSGGDGQGEAGGGLWGVVASILGVIQSLFSLLVYAGGLALNASVYYSVVRLGEFMNTSPGLAVAWGTFRDLGNIALLFGFIAIGIATMLDLQNYNAKKILGKLLIIAVVMNFSSLIARGIVDSGNVVALQFYKAINGGDMPSDSFVDTGISGRLVEATKLTSIYNGDTLPAGVSQSPGTSMAFILFSSIILYIVVAFVFFAIAILFVARMVILIFLITISPLAFAAMALPYFNKESAKWWKNLIDNTLVAPLLILMLWVSTKVISDGTLTNNLGSWNDTGTPTWANVIIMFGITCGFFLASLLIAKNLSAFGAATATKWGGKLAFGTTGWVGRQTLGRGMNAASRAIRRTGFGQTEFGRLAAGGLDRAASSSFDLRATKLGSTALKEATGGLGSGEAGGKGGYREMEKKAIDTRAKYGKSLQENDPGGKDARARDAAQERIDRARGAAAAAGKAKDTAARASAAAQKEIDDIEEEKKKDKYWETNPENRARLTAAAEKLRNAKDRESAADAAKKAADAAKAKEEEDSQPAVDYVNGLGKKAALNYATNLTKSSKGIVDALRTDSAKGVINSVAGLNRINSKAGNKIKGTLNKSDKDKLLDMITAATETGGDKPKEAAPEKKP